MPEEMPKQQRQVAVHSYIKEILEGEYKREEGWLPNYVLTKAGEKISRVNIIGIIIEVNLSDASRNSYSEIIIDDGTGRISVREFEQTGKLNKFSIGEIVLIIGRPREFGNEKYILLEIIKKIEDKRWLEIRKLEMAKKDYVEYFSGMSNIEQLSDKKNNKRERLENVGEEPIVEEPLEDEKSEGVKHETLTSMISRYLRESDTGDGVVIEDVINYLSNKAALEQIDSTLQEMLKQGILFEIKPGIVKFLE